MKTFKTHKKKQFIASKVTYEEERLFALWFSIKNKQNSNIEIL